MVWCMYKGVVWNTSKDEEVKGEEEVGEEGKNDEADRLVLQYRLASQHIKVVEDEFDNNGRPKVKIIYVDGGEYPWEISMLNRYRQIYESVVEWEKRQAAKRQCVGPRLIFVTQDRDFWPDSQKDPECALRAKEKLEKSEGYPGADYHHTNVYDMDRPRSLRKYFASLFNPELPGGRFILENIHPFDLDESGVCWPSDDEDDGGYCIPVKNRTLMGK